jgi:LAS superfamily LD-carboxypeptidase LdcB
LVNKEYVLPASYIPNDLQTAKVRFALGVIPDRKKMKKEAAIALEELMLNAEKEQIMLYCVSGYRSYETQKAIFTAKVKVAGADYASKYVAYPGKSEHQTGLAMDLTNKSGINKSLSDGFGQTLEGKWLKENASRFGFIIRYQEGKKDLTGYNYEPWHIRYVGKKVAEIIKTDDLTLEEYISLYLEDFPAQL